jgi:hypothetical protein
VRSLLASVCLALLVPFAPAAHADAPTAATYAVIDVHDDGTADVTVLCTATNTATDTESTTVACDVYDSSARPSIHRETGVTGPAGACVLVATGRVVPIEYCTTTTVRYRDGSSQSTTQCSHLGGGPTPHHPPEPPQPGLGCSDPRPVES